MPNPKRQHSKSRRNKRRTHYKALTPTLTVCKVSGQTHEPHRAFWHEGKLYYDGKVMRELS